MPAILWLFDGLIIAIVGLRPGFSPSILVEVETWDIVAVNDDKKNADGI